jgi:large subunit ribosomal protein L13
MRVKTWTPKAQEIERNWWVIDAKDQTLGRVASQIAYLLRGKHKPQFSPHMDVGDFVIVINAERIHVTGRRLDQKFYYRHSGYPGGIKSVSLRKQLELHPERVIEAAVRGMLPKNRLGRQMFGKLKVYAGAEHPHAAQKPQLWDGQVK